MLCHICLVDDTRSFLRREGHSVHSNEKNCLLMLFHICVVDDTRLFRVVEDTVFSNKRNCLLMLRQICVVDDTRLLLRRGGHSVHSNKQFAATLRRVF